jgi:FkbM family methyltransferase
MIFPRKALKHIMLKKIIGYIRYSLLDGWALKSYAQEGEDMILRRIFAYEKNGFYVDVGAHHPKRFSNTYFFYKQGWSGINIDAMPGSMKTFKEYRPRDINIEVPISVEPKLLQYYIFNETALNGFDPELSKNRDDKLSQYKIVEAIDLETRRLDDVLDQYLPKDKVIDFLSIDVEGLDFEVLESNNWNKYKPEVVLIEIIGSTLSELQNHKISQFLSYLGYTIYAKTVNTVIYKITN